jgi:hypothetical protein
MIADVLEVAGNLTRHHFEIPGAEEARSGAEIGNGVELGGNAVLVKRALGGNFVLRIESRKVEALAKDKDAGDEIAATAGDTVGRVVASSAGVSVGTRDAVESAIADEGLGGVRKGTTGPFGERTNPSFLIGKVRRKEQPPLCQKVDKRSIGITQMGRNRHLLADRLSRDGSDRRKRQDERSGHAAKAAFV